MAKTIHAFTLGLLLNAGAAFGLTIEAEVDGPLLKQDSVVNLVNERLGGAVAIVPDGGKHRLRVRVTSKFSERDVYLYMVDFQLQRRVTDCDTGRIYWASTRSGSSWGNVPSETELRQTIGELVERKVNVWPVE